MRGSPCGALPTTRPSSTRKRPRSGRSPRHLFGNRAFLRITIGATLVGFVGYGTGTFAFAYFIRMFHVGYAELGLAFGLVTGLSAGLGTLLGGWMSDWAGRRDRSWYALLPAIGLLFATPLYIIAFTRGDWVTAVWWMLLPGLFHYAYIGPTLGVMQNLALPRMRATATALFFVAGEPDRPGRGAVCHRRADRLRRGPAVRGRGSGRFRHAVPGWRGRGGRRRAAAPGLRQRDGAGHAGRHRGDAAGVPVGGRPLPDCGASHRLAAAARRGGDGPVSQWKQAHD
ncbi:MFS transporter [Rhodanobacter lindaniclasticus]